MNVSLMKWNTIMHYKLLSDSQLVNKLKKGKLPTRIWCQPRLGLRPRSLVSGVRLLSVYILYPKISKQADSTHLCTSKSISINFLIGIWHVFHERTERDIYKKWKLKNCLFRSFLPLFGKENIFCINNMFNLQNKGDKLQSKSKF